MNRSSARDAAPPSALGLGSSFAIYASGAALLTIAVRLVAPGLVGTGIEPILAWFLAAGLGVFAPLVLLAAVLVASEPRPKNLNERLWLRPMTPADWLWTAIGALAIAVLTAPLATLLISRYGADVFRPDFLIFAPLTLDRLWILAAWAPFFLLNMLGEAFVWHAAMLPRQAARFGAAAWLVSALGWMLFHVALPWQIVAVLAPTMLVIPFLVQRRRNVWIGVVLHVLVNGPGFLAAAFGLL